MSVSYVSSVYLHCKLCAATGRLVGTGRLVRLASYLLRPHSPKGKSLIEIVKKPGRTVQESLVDNLHQCDYNRPGVC